MQCGFPAFASAAEVEAFAAGKMPHRPDLSAKASPGNGLLVRLAAAWRRQGAFAIPIVFWAAGVAFLPITAGLAYFFGTHGYGGPGGWGSTFFILIIGWCGVSPTLVACGVFALLGNICRSKGRRFWAAVFFLLMLVALAILGPELYLLMEFLKDGH